VDFAKIRTLVAVETWGSMGAAAEHLCLSASAVSQQVSRLETEVGCRLVEPYGRGVQLTDMGHLLVGHGRRLLALVEEAEAELQAKRGTVTGRLKVAAFPTANRGLIPPVLAGLRNDYPDLRIGLVELAPEDAVLAVASGDVDLGVVHDWHQTPLAVPEPLEQSALGLDFLDVALPSAHPLAQRHSVDLVDLASERWVSSPPGASSRDWLARMFRGTGARPDIAYEVAEYASQLALVAAGLGAAVIPRLGRPEEAPGVRIVRVEPTVSRRVFSVWRPQSARRPAIVAALKALRSQMDPSGEHDESSRAATRAG
jgi:DNA-binding transcriptional LysR family regulator